jgi:hypothetical protein
MRWNGLGWIMIMGRVEKGRMDLTFSPNVLICTRNMRINSFKYVFLFFFFILLFRFLLRLKDRKRLPVLLLNGQTDRYP